MSPEQQQFLAGIAALETQRSVVGDAVVDASIAGLRARLAALSAAAETSPRPAQALKQVSILFLDVVGSTKLSQRLDPEAISEVMDDALSRGTAVVESHGGRVLQYAGDNILAAFGAETAREDDAERAVRCGLALLELGRALQSEVLASHRHAGFNVRVGVHTGGVLLGGGVDADGSIRGIAVNIAARMEQTAPAGGLRISHDTYAEVRGLFEVEAQEPLVVKGFDAPVQSYLVRGAKPRNFRIGRRGIEGVATRMIGRDAELEELQAAFKRLFKDRKLAAVTVVADAGIGKSRLLYEFQVWSEMRPEAFFLFRGRATPQTSSQTFGLLRDILAWRFQINDDDSIAAARAKMEQGIVPLFVDDDGPDLAEGHTHLLGHLIGIDWRDSRHIRGILDDPRQIRNRAFHAAAQFFRRVGAKDGTPVLLQLEDLHWADSESLDFLTYLAEVNRDVPMLLLSFTRPTLFERRAEWRGTGGIHQCIDLAPLGKDMSRMLANELLQKLREIPAALRELLTSSAEGNPFYMEELMRMLIDQGAIVVDDPWSVNAERLLVTKVPQTLTGVLQARLDGLPPLERRALQQASVVGSVFWDQALAAVDTQATEQLPALVQRELTLPRPETPLEGVREYAFRHQVLHKVTYDTVLKRPKRDAHAKVAHWLARFAEQGGLRAGDFLGLAAEHFEQAGDDLNAAEFHARAAEQAELRMAHERVLVHVSRALELLGTPQTKQAELRWRLLSTRERTLGLRAQRDKQADDIDALAELADALNDSRRRADAAWRRSHHAMRIADWASMENAARQGLALATTAGDDGLRLHSLRLLAYALVRRGEVEAGRALALEGLAEARSLKLRGIEARMLNALGGAHEMQGEWVGLLATSRQSLLSYRDIGDRINEAIALLNVGVAWMRLGDIPHAGREFDAALSMLRANGDRAMEGAALGNLSTLAVWQGDETRALTLARQSLEIARSTNARDLEVVAMVRLGEAELALGRLAEARLAYLRARELGRAIDVPSQHDATAGLARVALAGGDAGAAVTMLQPVLDLVASGGSLAGTEETRQIELTCHQALTRAGDPHAADWLAAAHKALTFQAEAISDSAMRDGFLHNIPHHRVILAAWARCGGTGSQEVDVDR